MSLFDSSFLMCCFPEASATEHVAFRFASGCAVVEFAAVFALDEVTHGSNLVIAFCKFSTALMNSLICSAKEVEPFNENETANSWE